MERVRLGAEERNNRMTDKGKRKVISGFLCSGMLFAGVLTMFSGCGKKQEPWQKITEEELLVEGISGEYHLLFLTDTHVVIQDDKDTDQIKEYTDERVGMFRNQEGVSSENQFHQWMKYANEEKMDGVLLGGDIIDCPSQGSLNYLEKELGSLQMPYVYTPGNHDWTFPWEYMTEVGKKEYLPMIAPFMGGNTAVHYQDFGEFIVVSVDNSPGQVNPEALSVYREVLAKEKPVIVLAHVPFLTQSVLTKAREAWKNAVVIGGGNYGGIYPDEFSEEFLKMTTAKDSPVAAVLAGHVHFYDKDVIDGEKQVMQIVGDAGFHGSAIRLTVKGTK